MNEYDKETREHRGITITVTWECDPDMGPPWKEHDGHGPVSDWRDRDSKRAGERILHEDRGICRFYDFAEAIKLAKKDGWGSKMHEGGVPKNTRMRKKSELEKKLGRIPTEGDIAHAAVEEDFEYLRSWCNDGWSWIAYSVKIEGYPMYSESCCGFESCADDHIRETTDEAFGSAIEWIDKEIENSEHAAACDIITK